MSWKTVVLAPFAAFVFGAVMNGVALAADPGSLQVAKQGHVVCGDILNVPEGTIEFWMKPASRENNEWAVGKSKDKASAMEFGFGPATLMFMVKRNGEWVYTGVAKERIPLNEWSHVACTFSKQKATLFVNGKACLKEAAAGDFSMEHLAGGAFAIGKGSQNEFFRGLLAEVRLSKSLRYTGDFTPPKTPFSPDADTVALYHFDGEGDTVADASGKGLNGKVSGDATRSKDSPFAVKTP
jgi:hypothetical protein